MTEPLANLLGLPVMGFHGAADLDAWVASQPRTSKGIWLRLIKKGQDIAGVARNDAVDIALCHGWIDGQARSWDAISWLVRFMPRRRHSLWSQVNRSRAGELIGAGRMREGGLVEIAAAHADGRWAAAYAPPSTATIPPDMQAAFDGAPAAVAAFAALSATRRYAILQRINTARKAETRARQIEQIVVSLAMSMIGAVERQDMTSP